MPESSCSSKLGFKRNEYNRVSFGRKEVAKKIELDQNAELLRDRLVRERDLGVDVWVPEMPSTYAQWSQEKVWGDEVVDSWDDQALTDIRPTHGQLSVHISNGIFKGESVPVTKTPLPNSPDILYDSKEHARHTLFCGTQVIQTRYFGNELVLAIVIRTGFSTAKGSLVRSIMYPPPVDFKFEHDSYRFVELLAAIASIGFVYTVITKFMRGISLSTIALEALDLITIVVPPALPAAMTVGRYYAQSRLENKGIYCISPRTINVSGSIDCVCFDKTGTLTEDGLDMWGVVPVTDKKFQVPVKFIDKMIYDDIIFGMVTCHSLTIIDGKLSGDPLDLKMFHSTGWLLEEPEVNDNSKFEMIFPTIVRPPKTNEPSSHSKEEEYFSDKPPLEIGIVRQFPFSSSLQRMSVISRRLGASHFHVYCKGSPETILSLSIPDTSKSLISFKPK
uniref:Cation-transporting ATPase n=1 Tax=Timema douglasi TaxID=61478 RepID=A0A7R8VN15_TIMDO|nr:unnamed protein product [Timema douglasi]